MWVSYCLNHRGYPIMPEAYSSGTLLVEPCTGPICPRNVIRRERPANGTRFRNWGLYYISYTHGNRYYCREVTNFQDGFRYVPDGPVLFFTNPELFMGLNNTALNDIRRYSPTLDAVRNRTNGRLSRFRAKVWPPESKRTRYQNMREEIV